MPQKYIINGQKIQYFRSARFKIMAQDYKVSVISNKQLTPNIWQLDVCPEDPAEIDFIAGQCVSFHVAEKEKRLYSIMNIPEHKNILSFCVDVSPAGFGSNFTLALKVGDTFTLDGPHGIFTIKDFERDLLFVCTGAGVAPFKSMITDAFKKGFAKKITMLFGVRDEDNIIYFDYFQDIASRYPNFEFIPMLSQPKGQWQGQAGRVTAFLDSNIQKYMGRLAYICGSLAMIKDVRKKLMDSGFGIRDIKIENFG